MPRQGGRHSRRRDAQHGARAVHEQGLLGLPPLRGLRRRSRGADRGAPGAAQSERDLLGQCQGDARQPRPGRHGLGRRRRPAVLRPGRGTAADQHARRCRDPQLADGRNQPGPGGQEVRPQPEGDQAQGRQGVDPCLDQGSPRVPARFEDAGVPAVGRGGPADLRLSVAERAGRRAGPAPARECRARPGTVRDPGLHGLPLDRRGRQPHGRGLCGQPQPGRRKDELRLHGALDSRSLGSNPGSGRARCDAAAPGDAEPAPDRSGVAGHRHLPQRAANGPGVSASAVHGRSGHGSGGPSRHPALRLCRLSRDRGPRGGGPDRHGPHARGQQAAGAARLRPQDARSRAGGLVLAQGLLRAQAREPGGVRRGQGARAPRAPADAQLQPQRRGDQRSDHVLAGRGRDDLPRAVPLRAGRRAG